MLYRPTTPPTTTTILTVTGRNLAHGHRSVLELAFLGNDLRRNHTQLISPTIKQCAALVGVCVPYVRGRGRDLR